MSGGGLKSALPPDDESTTGLPGLRTWSAVYVAVIGVFVLWVVLLSWLSAAFK